MSARIERLLRTRRKNNETSSPRSSLRRSNSLSLDNGKRRKSDFSVAVDFTSETLSSSTPPKLDTISVKKAPRRKIRSTQDFNYLSTSTSQDSDELTKHRIKKAKKNKVVYDLPKISQVTEDCHHDLHNEKIRKKSRKRRDRESENNENSRKCANKSQNSKENLTIQLMKQNISNSQSSDDEYQSAYSTVSDDQRDSDIVIKKSKKNSRKKKSNKNKSKTVDSGETERNFEQSYAVRIQMLLSDSTSKRNRNINSLSSSTPMSGKMEGKTDKRSFAKKRLSSRLSSMQIKSIGTPEVNTTSNGATSLIASNDKQIKTPSRISTSSSGKLTLTPYPKAKIRNSSFETFRKKQKVPTDITICETSPSKNLSLPKDKKINKKSGSSEYLSSDLDFECDDVFNDTFVKVESEQTISNDPELTSRNLLTSDIKVKTRKSVRFQSPKEIIQRKTFSLPKSTPSTPVSNFNEFPDENLSLNSSANGSLLQTTSPNVNEASKIQMLYNSSSNKQNTPYKRPTSALRSSTNTSMKRKSNVELISPLNKTPRRESNIKSYESTRNKSASNLATPGPGGKKTNSSVTVLDNNAEESRSVLTPLIRQSTFSINEVETLDAAQTEEIEPLRENTILSDMTPNLIRSGTFIKDETVEQATDLAVGIEYGSPIQFNISGTKILDTSKVNKRRRWDKSRLSISFLENSIELGNTSTPWHGDDSYRTNDTPEVNISKQNLKNEDNPKLRLSSSKVSFKNVGTSTPVTKGKNNLLRQALLKDKQDITVKAKSEVGQIEKVVPKITRTKIPNFALIHKRALDKLENIKEMSERKTARAKLLLSGHKPLIGNTSETSSNRKELKFSPTVTLPTNQNKSINKNVNLGVNNSNISITKIKNLSPSRSNPVAQNKENRLTPIEKKRELLKAKIQESRSKVPNPVVAEKKGFTRFGFKIGPERVKTATKDEQVKAVSAKTKIGKDMLQERRNVIHGVRSNRRFELLMNMRKK